MALRVSADHAMAWLYPVPKAELATSATSHRLAALQPIYMHVACCSARRLLLCASLAALRRAGSAAPMDRRGSPSSRLGCAL
jgi:hypothetical protein